MLSSSPDGERVKVRARGRGAQRKLAAIAKLQEVADRAERVAAQIKQRLAGEPITERLVSMFDPDARPIRKGKLGKPNEFGYVLQICEVTQNTRRGARGFILPAPTLPGNPPESKLLPTTTAELGRLGLCPREVALDGGFEKGPTSEALQELSPERVFIAGPSAARLKTHPAPARQIPHRSRGQDQPPQAQLRTAAIAPEGPGRDEGLERLGDPRLQCMRCTREPPGLPDRA
ncbi:MAG: hypothetical protein H0X28_02540 [Solirubrobacterales bacterium]|nr:hypothetical protein [Solirubrobacterales bacterium]